MKSLIIIWVLVLVTIIGGTVYMNHTINNMIKRLPEDNTSVLTGFNSLEVQNSNSTQLQPVQALYEDEETPAQVIQPTEFIQVTRHYWFIQGTEWGYEVTYDPQLAEDVTLSNGATPLVIYGTLDTQGLIKL